MTTNLKKLKGPSLTNQSNEEELKRGSLFVGVMRQTIRQKRSCTLTKKRITSREEAGGESTSMILLEDITEVRYVPASDCRNEHVSHLFER